MNDANEIAQLKEEKGVEKCSGPRLDLMLDCRSVGHCGVTLGTASRRHQSIISSTTKSDSLLCVEDTKAKDLSKSEHTTPVVDESPSKDTANMFMLGALPRSVTKGLSSQNGQESQGTSISDQIGPPNTVLTEEIRSSSALRQQQDEQEKILNLVCNNDTHPSFTPRKNQMKCNWYDAHCATERRTRQQEMTNADDVNQQEIDEMMKKCNHAQLREKLFVVQQQLHSYNSLLDDYEKSKAQNEELQRKVGDYENKFKKLAQCYKKKKNDMKDREDQIVQMKVELAEATGREDHHHSQICKLTAVNTMLKEQNEELRQKNAFLTTRTKEKRTSLPLELYQKFSE